MKAIVLPLAVLAGCAHVPPGATTPQVGPLARVAFADSFVHELPAAATGRRYQVWVDLPASYATSSRRYPVVFVTDPNWSFGMVRSIRDLLGQDGRNIEDFILVGLTHEVGTAAGTSRSRDYTPSDPLRDPARNADDYSFPRYGEAEAYRNYIQSQVFPLIASRYRADMARKTFLGHSYGGLFGAYVLLTRPDMFGTYILGSPSLWFDRKHAFRLERDFAATHRDLRARVMMVTGGDEVVGTGPGNNTINDLVADMRAFEAALRARGYAGLTVVSRTIPDEDHLTVFPDVATRGLLWALPGNGPYDGG